MSKKKNNRTPKKKNSVLRVVELNPVVSWTCDDCGTENYWHVLMAQTPGGVIANTPEAVQCGCCDSQFAVDCDFDRFKFAFRRSDEHGGCDDEDIDDESEGEEFGPLRPFVECAGDEAEPDADDEDVELEIDDEWDVDPDDDDDDFDDDDGGLFGDDGDDDDDTDDDFDDDDGGLFGDDGDDDDEDDWGDEDDDVIGDGEDL